MKTLIAAVVLSASLLQISAIAEPFTEVVKQEVYKDSSSDANSTQKIAVPEILTVTPEEFSKLSYSILDNRWKVFDKGFEGNQVSGVEYAYFYHTDDNAYVGIMKYANKQSVQNLLLGSVYRAEKEKWNVKGHKQISKDGADVTMFRVDYQDDQRIKNKQVNITYLAGKNDQAYMITFMVSEESYKPDMFDHLISKFNP